MKNTLPDKSGNLESLKKQSQQFESFSTNMPTVSENSLRAFYRLFLFTTLWFKWLMKKHCVAKILLAIWEIFLHENNRNCNSCKCSYKFAFIHFLSLQTKNKNLVFSKLVVWSREVFLFFAYSESRSTSKSCRIQ